MKKETAASWSDIHSRESKKRHRAFLAASSISIFVLFVGMAWLVVYSPAFRIKGISVAGNRHVSSDEIIAFANSRIRAGSWLEKIMGAENILAWPKSFSGSELRLMPEINSISVRKYYWGRKIEISVEERQPYGVWCFAGPGTSADIQSDSAPDCFWFDNNGVLFKRAAGMEGSIFTVMDDYSQKNPGIGSGILPDEFVQNALSIFRAVSASGLSVKEIRLNDLALQEMEVDTYGGPAIYFSLRFSADNAQNVINVLKQKGGFEKLQYIDFRVENRVYYK